MTGAELRAHRTAARLSQRALARHAEISRDAVQYWERKPVIDPYGWAVKRIAKALGIGGLAVFLHHYARTGGRGLTEWDTTRAQLDAEVDAKIAAMKQREALRTARRRVGCGAKTRKDTSCRNMSEPGKSRCKFHGGKSTGPKSPEGRERIAAAQRARWAIWRVR